MDIQEIIRRVRAGQSDRAIHEELGLHRDTVRKYRQKATCQREGVPFQSKVDLLDATIRDFQPVPDTLTHVLVDSWYTCKRIWHAARERGFLITSGLKANRWLWVVDAQQQGRWMRLNEYAAQLPPAQYQKMTWPDQGEPCTVYVHVVRTRVRKLYTCQVVIARFALDCPLKAVRYWASSDLDADTPTLIAHIAARWDIEVLFGDAKALLGLDHYQLMDATAILRFWTLVMAAYAFLDEERARLQHEQPTPVTLGDARREVQRRHWRHVVDWIHQQFSSGVTPDALHVLLVARLVLQSQLSEPTELTLAIMASFGAGLVASPPNGPGENRLNGLEHFPNQVI